MAQQGGLRPPLPPAGRLRLDDIVPERGAPPPFTPRVPEPPALPPGRLRLDDIAEEAAAPEPDEIVPPEIQTALEDIMRSLARRATARPEGPPMLPTPRGVKGGGAPLRGTTTIYPKPSDIPDRTGRSPLPLPVDLPELPPRPEGLRPPLPPVRPEARAVLAGIRPAPVATPRPEGPPMLETPVEVVSPPRAPIATPRPEGPPVLPTPAPTPAPSRIDRQLDFNTRLDAVVREMAQLGHPVRVVSGRRTAQQQAELFKRGRSAPGPIVTEKSGEPGEESLHQLGQASDLAFRSAKNQPWDLLGRVAKKHGLEWGGDWTTLVDRPHVQLPRGVEGGEALLGDPFDLALAAIANAEGFYKSGSTPQRAHNPGNLKMGGRTTPTGITIFKSDAEGWAALRRQLEQIAEGKSRFYKPDATIEEIGKTWTATEKDIWAANVAKALGVGVNAKLRDVLKRRGGE